MVAPKLPDLEACIDTMHKVIMDFLFDLHNENAQIKKTTFVRTLDNIEQAKRVGHLMVWLTMRNGQEKIVELVIKVSADVKYPGMYGKIIAMELQIKHDVVDEQAWRENWFHLIDGPLKDHIAGDNYEVQFVDTVD